MKRFICEKGHEFDDSLTIGQEESETEVCPVCKTDNFTLNEPEDE